MIRNDRIRSDLHIHTNASDGRLSPAAMVQLAEEKGITHLGICDHDTTAGIAEAVQAGERSGIRILRGVELSCGHGEEIHLLGYGYAADGALEAFLDSQLAARWQRILAMLEKLRAMGFPIAPEDVKTGNARFMGRLQVADAMVKKGYVPTARQAFSRYLNPGKAAYVPRERVLVSEGIRALCSVGATVVLAHPGRYRMDAQTLQALLPEWMDAGLAGIEAYHASHDKAQRQCYDRMAQANGLLVTGGSDCHGREDGAQIGDHIAAWSGMQADTQALLSRL